MLVQCLRILLAGGSRPFSGSWSWTGASSGSAWVRTPSAPGCLTRTQPRDPCWGCPPERRGLSDRGCVTDRGRIAGWRLLFPGESSCPIVGGGRGPQDPAPDDPDRRRGGRDRVPRRPLDLQASRDHPPPRRGGLRRPDPEPGGDVPPEARGATARRCSGSRHSGSAARVRGLGDRIRLPARQRHNSSRPQPPEVREPSGAREGLDRQVGSQVPRAALGRSEPRTQADPLCAEFVQAGANARKRELCRCSWRWLQSSCSSCCSCSKVRSSDEGCF